MYQTSKTVKASKTGKKLRHAERSKTIAKITTSQLFLFAFPSVRIKTNMSLFLFLCLLNCLSLCFSFSLTFNALSFSVSVFFLSFCLSFSLHQNYQICLFLSPCFCLLSFLSYLSVYLSVCLFTKTIKQVLSF